jgi:hypothetical protein
VRKRFPDPFSHFQTKEKKNLWGRIVLKNSVLGDNCDLEMRKKKEPHFACLLPDRNNERDCTFEMN